MEKKKENMYNTKNLFTFILHVIKIDINLPKDVYLKVQFQIGMVLTYLII